jgi:hypothetical protein
MRFSTWPVFVSRPANKIRPGPLRLLAGTIPPSEFISAGVKMTAVKSLTIGVGNKAAPQAGGIGTMYIDDIGFGHPASGN